MVKAKKEVPTKRNGRYYPPKEQKELTRESYTAVTEILGNSIDKSALRYWFGLQAARAALHDPSLNEKEVMSEVGKISGKAASRGRTVHNLTEAIDIKDLKGEDLIDISKLPKEIRPYIEAFTKFKEEVNPKLIFNEQIVFNNEHSFAGTLDRVYDMGGKINLVDIKTSKDFYKDMSLQLSAYKHGEYIMHKDKTIEPMVDIDGMYILLLGADGNYAIRQMQDSFSVFLSAFNIYKCLHADKMEAKK